MGLLEVRLKIRILDLFGNKIFGMNYYGKLLVVLLFFTDVTLYCQNIIYEAQINDKNLEVLINIEKINDSLIILNQNLKNQNDSLAIYLYPGKIIINPEMTKFGREDLIFLHFSVAEVQLSKMYPDIKLIKLNPNSHLSLATQSVYRNLNKTNGMIIWIDYLLENEFIKTKIKQNKEEQFIKNNNEMELYVLTTKDYSKNCQSIRMIQNNMTLFNKGYSVFH